MGPRDAQWWCKVVGQDWFEVADCDECRTFAEQYGGGYRCQQGDPRGGGGGSGSCFFRDVLTAEVSGFAFNLASTETISRAAVDRWFPDAAQRTLRSAFVATDDPDALRVTDDGRALLARVALDAFAEVAAAAETAAALRDDVLAKSERGRQLVADYYANQKAIVAAATRGSDTALLGDFRAAWTSATPFVQALIAAGRGERVPNVQLTQARYAQAVDIVRRFRDATGNERLKGVLTAVEQDLAPFAGLTARAAYRRIEQTR